MKLYVIPKKSGILGMSIWPFILLNRRYMGKTVPAELINHERIHLRQQIELLVLPFYLIYLIEYTFKGYLSISFEKEAYGNEFNPEYLNGRKFWAFLKYWK
jgi:hypothetical protein